MQLNFSYGNIMHKSIMTQDSTFLPVFFFFFFFFENECDVTGYFKLARVETCTVSSPRNISMQV